MCTYTYYKHVYYHYYHCHDYYYHGLSGEDIQGCRLRQSRGVWGGNILYIWSASTVRILMSYFDLVMIFVRVSCVLARLVRISQDVHQNVTGFSPDVHRMFTIILTEHRIAAP